MASSRRHREPGGRMYDEPGVGARSGMRVKDGAFDLDDFLEAGRRALNQGSSTRIGLAHQPYTDDDSDDESVGTARQAITSPRASSSMLIVESPGPSPRSTIRHSRAPSSSPFISSPGTVRNQSPKPRVQAKIVEAIQHSSDGNGSISMSSPSKLRAPKRLALAAGLEARKERRRLEELERESIARREETSQSVASSSRQRIESEDESTIDGDEHSIVEDDGEDGGTYMVEYDDTVDHAVEDTSGRQENLDNLQEFESRMSESLGERQPSPSLIEIIEQPKEGTKTKAIDVEKTSKDKNKKRSILQEKNGVATQSKGTVLAKARKKAIAGSARKQKTLTEQESDVGQRKVIEKIPSSYHRQQSVDEGDGQDDGLRRGSRYRYKPLEYWRGEKARFGRPSLPKVSHDDVGDETIDGDAFEDHFAGVIPPVAVLKEIIRVPRLEGEGTFSGMKIRKERSSEQTKAPVLKKPRRNDQSSSYELDPTQPTRHAESGWDDDTEMKAMIWDAESKAGIEMQVACTSSQVRPRLAVNSTFGFEKMFVVDHNMASGILFILVDGAKQTKSSKENNYTFVVLEGAVKVHLHKSIFTIAPHGMFFVPANNDYSIENISKRTAKVAFTQCRNRPVS